MNVDRQPHDKPENHDPHAPNTASDDPSTTNSKSSVRKLNWKGGLGGGRRVEVLLRSWGFLTLD